MYGREKKPVVFEENVPLHVQVREMIRQKALSGEIVDDQGRLPDEAELVKFFGVSRMTIRSAIAPLVSDGLIDRSRGRGTFLRAHKSEVWMGRLIGLQELIKEAGHTPGARVLHYGMTNALDNMVREALNERAAWELRRVRYADGIPIAIEHAYYPPDIGLELEKRDLVSIIMYRVLEEDLGFGIKHGSQTIGAKISTSTEEEELDLNGASALVTMERLTVAMDDRPVELLRSVYRPDIFQFSINLTRRVY